MIRRRPRSTLCPYTTLVRSRCFSSGALSIWSKAVKVVLPEVSRSASVLVMAAVSVVLPWSMWPIVPMFRWGLSRSEEHTSELQSRQYLVCRLLLEKKKYLLNLIDLRELTIYLTSPSKTLRFITHMIYTTLFFSDMAALFFPSGFFFWLLSL